MNSLVVILNVLELVSCITGFLYWNKIKHSYWKWFPVYLAVILLSEIIGEYLSHIETYVHYSITLYRYFVIPFEFVFFYWIFYRYFNTNGKSKWPFYAAAIYLICLFIDLLYIEGKMKLLFDSFSYTVGNILLLILILMFFIKFIKSDELLKYSSSNMFWVCLGLLVFFLGSLPFYGLRTTLYRQYRDFYYVYWYIQFGLNYLMYIFFAISFIWGKPK